MEKNILLLLWGAGPVVKLVLLLLFLCSLLSWAIFFRKKILFSKLEENDREFLNFFRREIQSNRKPIDSLDSTCDSFKGIETSLRTLSKGVLFELKLLKDVSIHQKVGVLNRSFEKGRAQVFKSLQKDLIHLSSISSLTPFIGLFGTVWGIVNAFQGLTKGNSTLDAVAPGISEALVATAVGLFVAIPAVYFYNFCQQKITDTMLRMDFFEKDLLNIVEAHELLEKK